MQRTESAELITFDQVSYAYPNQQDHWALRDVSLHVGRGEFLGVIGATGSGKSTLCLALNGIVPQFYGGQYFGRLTVADMDTLDIPVNILAQQVGMVFENPEMQLTAVTVQAEVAFALENAGIAPSEMRKRIPEALHWVGLDGLQDRHPQDLSGGQKQRLAIAAALALHPPILVLDEPSSQLDPWAAKDLFETLTTLNKTGITIIVASHAAELLAAHCDRIAVLDKGQLVAVDTPQAIYANAALMAQAHVRAPQVSETFTLLAEQGVPVAEMPVTLDLGIDLLSKIIAYPSLVNAHTRLASGSPLPCAGEEQSEGASYANLRSPSRRSIIHSPIPLAPILQTRNLSFAYDDQAVLHNVNIAIHQGEYVLLAGQNGAGKTTLLKHFLGLLRPQSGSVHVQGNNITGQSVAAIAQTIGYIAQNPDRQLFCNTVLEEVRFGLEAQRMPKAEIETRVEQNLARLDLSDYRDRHPLSLTRGQRTRLVIAAMLALEPDILIFDEPTVGQDHEGALAILDLSKRLHQAGKTIIVVTHHLHLMPAFAQRALILHNGRIVHDGTLRDALYDEAMLHAARLIAPQAVKLAQAVSLPHLLTPAEIAMTVAELLPGEKP